MSYSESLYKFKNREFYANRNETNLRLDSNLTIMPNIFLRHLTYNGKQLVSIDLRKSQFAILASMIRNDEFSPFLQVPLYVDYYEHEPVYLFPGSPKLMHHPNQLKTHVITQNHNDYTINYKDISTYISAKSALIEAQVLPISILNVNDLKLFLILAKKGQLYEYIRDAIELGKGEVGRGRAKQIMFEIFFSKHRSRNPYREKIRMIFPNLNRMISDYKKVYGDKAFPISLQRKESGIFIDNIKKELDLVGYAMTATKHDSVICPLDDQDQVKSVVFRILMQELGEFELKTELLN